MATSKSRESSSRETPKKARAAKKSSRARKSTSAKKKPTGPKAKAIRKKAPRETAAGSVGEQGENSEKKDVTTSRHKRKTKRGQGKDISRKELVQTALERLKDQLEKETDVTPATIGALEKLLKLDRDIVEEKEMPQEIRVLWQEINDESSKDK